MKEFLLGPARVRPQLNEIEIDGRCERLPPKFIDVLVALAERPDQVCAKNDLLQQVWGDPLTGDEALAHAIWVLRRTLGDDAKRPRFIQTVSRRGYRLLLVPQPIVPAAEPSLAATGPSADQDLPATAEQPRPSEHPDQPVAAAANALPNPAIAANGHAGARSLNITRRWGGALIALALLLGLGLWQSGGAPPVASRFDAGDRLSSLSRLDAHRVLLSRRDGELMVWHRVRQQLEWRGRLGAPATAPPLVDGDELLLGSDDGFLYALAIADGVERWRLQAEADLRATPALRDGLLELGNDRGLIQQLALPSRQPRWRRQLGGRIRGPLLSFAELSLHRTLDGQVRALRRSDGEPVWERRFDTGISDLRALDEQTVVFALESGLLVALAIADGRESWRVDLAAAASAPIVDNGQLFAIGRHGDGVLVEAGRGQILWRNRLPVAGYQQPLWWRGQIVVALDRAGLGLLDRERGVLHRRLQLPVPADHLLAVDDAVLVATLSGQLLDLPATALLDGGHDLRLDAEGQWHPWRDPPTEASSLEPLSTRPLPQARAGLNSVGNAQDLAFDADGNLYIGDSAGLTALDTDLQLRWRFPLSLPPGTQPLVVGERVYFGGNDGILYALSRDDGRELWRVQTTDKLRSAPRLLDDLLYFGGVDGSVYAVDAASGAVRWRYACGKDVHAALAVSREAVFAGSGDQQVHALDPQSGALRWKAPMGDWVVAEPALAHNTLFVGVADGSLRALDPASGVERWRFNSGGRIWFAVLVEGDLVYFASGDGHVYAIEAHSGNERWRQRVGTQAEGRLALHRGVLYAGSPDAFLYALDALDGRPLWRLATGGAVLNPSAAGDRLAVGSSDQRIHLLDLPAAE